MIAIAQPGRQLRIIATAPEIHHHFPRHRHRHLRPRVLAHEMQRQIDAGGNAGASIEPSVLDKNAIVSGQGRRRLLKQARHHLVVRRAAIAIKQTGARRQKRAGADADQRPKP